MPFATAVSHERIEPLPAAALAGLLSDNKKRFVAKWGAPLTCHYLRKVVGTHADSHIPATRLATLRVLWVDLVAPEPDRDSGSIRTHFLMQLLLAMRAHVTFAPTDWNRPERCVTLHAVPTRRTEGTAIRYTQSLPDA